MNRYTETTGIPGRSVSFFSRRQPPRLILVLLLTVLMAGMEWQSPPVRTTTPDAIRPTGVLPAVAAIQKSGLRTGDSITIMAFPVSIHDAKSMLSELKTRNVNIVFVFTQKQVSAQRSLVRRIENDGHRVLMIKGSAKQDDLSFHLNADDMQEDEMLPTLFDRCTLLCPAGNHDKWKRLLKISDILRIQGIRILVPQTGGDT